MNVTAPGTLVVENDEPMHVARSILETRYKTPNGKPGLRFWQKSFYQWYGGQWVKRDERWMENDLYVALENVEYEVRESGRRSVTERFAPNKNRVAEVARCIEVIQQVHVEGAPCWLGAQPAPSSKLDHCVAFQDVVVDVAATAQRWDGTGPVEWVTFERTEDYFDPVVLPVRWEDARDPEYYREKLTEWFSEPESRELWLRVFGVLLMPTQKYERAPVVLGRARGGKSTNMRLVKRLLGPAFFGTTMEAMIRPHGLEGMEGARCIVVNECTQLQNAAGQTFSGTWKNIVGRDETAINPKNKGQFRCVLPGKIVMVSNEIPKLPNKGEGMSSKMLFVNFDNSFRGREDFEMDQKLDQELAGIARMALEAAVRLERERDPGAKWPEGSRSRRVLDEFRLLNNPMDAFLEARFVKMGGQFATRDVIVRQWHDWVSSNNLRIHVPDNMLLLKLEQESTWGVMRHRTESARGMMGLVVRRQEEVADVL